jgi:hypothetical protein
MWQNYRILSSLCWSLVVLGAGTGWCPLAAAQAAQATPQASASDDLKIVIIEGEGFTNNLKRRIAREPIVEVRDRNDRPVAGAAVVFTLPSSGPSGTFANGSQVFNTVTGPNGRATAQAFRANDITGQFRINVTASHQGQTGSATIAQSNAAAVGGGLGAGATLAIIGAAAAATAVTLVRVLGGKTTSIGVGGPTAP